MIRLLHELGHRLKALTLRRRINQDLEDELLHHIELETEELILRGVEPDEARRQARIAFGPFLILATLEILLLGPDTVVSWIVQV